jgi:tetratricopeptide (TPR) repeat protein
MEDLKTEVNMAVEKLENDDKKTDENMPDSTDDNGAGAGDKNDADDDDFNDFNDDDDDDDDKSTSSTKSDDSDKAFVGDPEVLLIKATALKDEGNTFFKKQDFEKAARSYRRGTNALKPLNKGNTGDEQVKALLISLQTNLSMMCFKMNKHKQSLDVATSVLCIDRSNVKARYRRAIAHRKLGNYEDARHDLREALKQDPNNVPVRKELASIKKELETINEQQKKSLQKAFQRGGSLLYDDKEVDEKKKAEAEALKKKLQEEELKKRKVEWEDECVKRMSKGDNALSFEEWETEQKDQEEAKAKIKADEEKIKKELERKAREAAKIANKKEDSDDDSDDELTESELAQMRGYKKTSDGRVTSYFSREQSVKEKQLLGDIAPKRNDNNPAAVSSPENNAAGTGSSKWNQAGTWEEKDTTDWCRESLESRLKETKAESSGSGVAVVTEVKDMIGDASVATVSGKKRYIFDFHCAVSFDIREPDTDDVLATGTLNLPDICSTHHEELEVTFNGWKKAPASEHEQTANACRDALNSEVRESVSLWVKDFNEQY